MNTYELPVIGQVVVRVDPIIVSMLPLDANLLVYLEGGVSVRDIPGIVFDSNEITGSIQPCLLICYSLKVIFVSFAGHWSFFHVNEVVTFEVHRFR